VLTGNVNYTFILSGDNLGNLAGGGNDVPSIVRIGGKSCPSVTLLNSSTIECSGLDGKAGWDSTEVFVEVNLQSTSTSSLLSVYGNPAVYAISPNLASVDGGGLFSITGYDFGSQLGDIKHV